ncbi:hypothetical protein TRVA0_001S03576 [Trichomonascus vanleenenianus]|uniref:Tma64p n=1 Tax=Trichomonascus vanleenenianus TaxID=2268995 RepID=UPI003ECA8B6D
MFKRKAQIKPSANLKSSERKKLLKGVCEAFGLPEDRLGSEEKNKIMPKDLKSSKIQLHSGENALLYTTEKERPIWIGLGKIMVPTLFTLWQCPYLCPILLTPEGTIDNLQSGADLMARGVFDPLPERAPKGSVVAIATLKRPTVPVAVGIAQIDCHNISEETVGKAALTVSVIDDTLFEAYRGDKTAPKELDLNIPLETPETVTNDGEVTSTAEATPEEKTTPEEMATPEENATPEEKVIPEEKTTTEEKTTPEEKATAEEKEDNAEESNMKTLSLDAAAVDELFEQSLLQVLRKAIDSPLDLPMPSSQFLSQQLLPNLKIQDTNAVNMKKTSYKKATKFFKSMEKKGYLKSKERAGEVVILSIAGAENERVSKFNIYKVKKPKPAPSPTDPATTDAPSTQLPSDAYNPTDKMIAKEYYRPRSVFAVILAGSGISTDKYYSATDLRKAIESYISKNNLGQGKFVVPDEKLQNALKLTKKTPRDQIMPLVLKSSQMQHTITPPFSETEAKPRKGAIPMILLTTERRGGNKVVTIVSNLEPFHLNALDVAEGLRVACAGSTSVSDVREGSDLKQVLIQGNHVKNISVYLEKKGVRATWVEVNDKANKNKKK